MNARSAGSQSSSLRSVNMNNYPSQSNARQTPRLQNTAKSNIGHGNSNAGWNFSAPSTNGAFGSLGGAPGLGQARPGPLSGFAQVMGGGSAQGPIDMSDFPSLSGGPRSQQNSSTATGWNSNVIRQPSSQQQSQQQQQQQQSQPSQSQLPPPQQRAPSAAPSHQSLEQFDGPRSQQPSADHSGGDEFPPLSGQPSESYRNGVNGASDSSEDSNQHVQSSTQRAQLAPHDSANVFSQAQHSAEQSTSQPQPRQLSNGTATQSSSTVKRWADMTEDERWGMQGLLATFEARHQMEIGGQVDDTLPVTVCNGAMLMGQDLNTLGMDLESSEPLYPTFAAFPDPNGLDTIFDNRAHHPVPSFSVPSAYNVNNVPPLKDRINAFSDETLFRIFYENPSSTEQELAASELSVRDWRWHKVLRIWLQKDTAQANQSTSLPITDHTNGIQIGLPPVRTGERTERGVYIFFGALDWRRERREFNLDYDALDHRIGLGAMANGAGPGGAAQAAGGSGGIFGGMAGGGGGGGAGAGAGGQGLQGGQERHSSVVNSVA